MRNVWKSLDVATTVASKQVATVFNWFESRLGGLVIYSERSKKSRSKYWHAYRRSAQSRDDSADWQGPQRNKDSIEGGC
jgi:hypothetical protein